MKHTDFITQDFLKSILDYDPDTGKFTWRVSRGNRRSGKIAAIEANNSGYVQIKINGKSYKAHRLAWLWMTGAWPKDCIDHIDGDKTNNRFSNLRECTHAENHQNSKGRSHNTSGFTGVSLYKKLGRYGANIRVNGKQIYLGLYDTPEQAHAAYLEAKANLHTFNPVPRQCQTSPL